MRRMMIPLALLSAILLVGCNSYNLRYKADPQPSGANLFVDYTQLQDAVGISIDTDGHRLEDIFVTKTDGTVVRPLSISYAGMVQSGEVGTGVGGGSGHVGVGTGFFFPVGGERTRGLTTATFSSQALGAAPWALHIKVEGIHEAVVPALGGVPNAK